MTPYYEQDGIVIYCGDCRDVLPTLPAVDLVLTDPPYGLGLNHRNGSRGRGLSPYALCGAQDYPPVYGDDAPFDPAPLLTYPRVVLFGGNHYADRLPASSSWIVWDKLAGLSSKRDWGFNDQADVELAWSNLGGPARIIPLRWMGLIREQEHLEHRWHPTQKPVALMRLLIVQFTTEGACVLDPYMGSGTTLRAAKDCGRRAIGIEIEERYCQIAVERLRQGVLL